MMKMNNTKNKISPKLPKAQPVAVKEQPDSNKQEEEQSEDVSFRIKLENFLSGKVGVTIELVSLAFSLASVVAHALDTYFDGVFEKFKIMDIIIMLYYLVEYILQFYIAQHKLSFLGSFYSLICLISFSPLVFVLADLRITIYYKITLVLRLARIVRYLVKILSISKNEVSRQIYTIFLTVFSLVVIPAGIIQVFEADVRAAAVREQL